MTSSGKGKERKSVYGMKTPDSGTSIDGVSLKTRFGTRVDWMVQKMVTIGVCKRVEMRCSSSITRLGEGEGVTPGYTNQPWTIDYHRYKTADSGTRFDLRLLIKHTMF